eukprot:gnl/MRDRNA2_/MRDRNA2_86717_c0_seq5.p1 gnl/MRDRNA2_/MRDRNA2_86717_c0~~gnl/MRDRNA2_/MRDRNA2_86717_c0_seq5.p1  ORF type:complete len:188 (-),score=13.98 gnl/MRDRNA2_/MRDRNA2_86717_c0_seq5:630-1193(-)
MVDLVKDKSTGQCKGYGFCIYKDSSVTDIACNALNGFKLGERSLTVKRALIYQSEQTKNNSNHTQDNKQSLDLLDEFRKNEDENENNKKSRFIVISDCLNDGDLDDAKEYKDIVEDMRKMFEQYGLISRLLIPRMREKGRGKVIIEFDNISQAMAAKVGMQGKFFCDKPVLPQFMDENDIKKLLQSD